MPFSNSVYPMWFIELLRIIVRTLLLRGEVRLHRTSLMSLFRAQVQMLFMLVSSVCFRVKRKLSLRTSRAPAYLEPFFVRSTCQFSYPITRTETFDQHSLSDELPIQCQSEYWDSVLLEMVYLCVESTWPVLKGILWAKPEEMWDEVGIMLVLNCFWVCKKIQNTLPKIYSELCCQKTNDMSCMCSRGHCLNVLVRDVLGLHYVGGCFVSVCACFSIHNSSGCVVCSTAPLLAAARRYALLPITQQPFKELSRMHNSLIPRRFRQKPSTCH